MFPSLPVNKTGLSENRRPLVQSGQAHSFVNKTAFVPKGTRQYSTLTRIKKEQGNTSSDQQIKITHILIFRVIPRYSGQ